MFRIMIQLNDIEFENLIRCQKCMEIFDVPLVLPCGMTVCKRCLQNSETDGPECHFCNNLHMPEDKHAVNTSIELLLKIYKQSREQETLNIRGNQRETKYSSNGIGVINSAPIKSNVIPHELSKNNSVPNDEEWNRLLLEKTQSMLMFYFFKDLSIK